MLKFIPKIPFCIALILATTICECLTLTLNFFESSWKILFSFVCEGDKIKSSFCWCDNYEYSLEWDFWLFFFRAIFFSGNIAYKYTFLFRVIFSSFFSASDVCDLRLPIHILERVLKRSPYTHFLESFTINSSGLFPSSTSFFCCFHERKINKFFFAVEILKSKYWLSEKERRKNIVTCLWSWLK